MPEFPYAAIPKSEVVVAPSTAGWRVWITSHGDQLSPIVRGGGTALRLTFAGAATQSVDVQFGECVELHDGSAFWDAGFGFDDKLSFGALFPKSTPTSTPGTGNCNLVSIGGPYNRMKPAAGNGSHTVDLALAAPIRNSADTGYYDVDRETGAFTAVADVANPNGAFDVYDVDVLVWMIRKVSMGNSARLFDVDNYRVDWLHKNAKCRLEVAKASTGAGEIGAWLQCYRKNTT